MLGDRMVDGQLSTSFVKLDGLFARMFLLKVLPGVLAAYEVVRASETAAFQKSGQGYLPETLTSVCRTLERLHFPKAHTWVQIPLTHTPRSTITGSTTTGRGAWGGRTGGRGGHSGGAGGHSAPGAGGENPARAKETGCYNCKKLGHIARDCKEPALSRGQHGQLQVVDNKKAFLQQGLAHQQAGLRLHMVGKPGFAHKAETEAHIEALPAEIAGAEAEYSEMLARFGRDNKGKA